MGERFLDRQSVHPGYPQRGSKRLTKRRRDAREHGGDSH